MKETFDLLRPMAMPPFTEMSLEDLSIEYQYTMDPCVLASAFIKLHDMIMRISKKYYSISTDDKSSIALVALDKALQMFDPGKGLKFITFFYTVLDNAYGVELGTQGRAIRCANQNTEELNEFQVGSDEISTIHELIPPGILNEREMEICVMFANGCRVADVARELGFTGTYITKIKNEIANKLHFLRGR